MLMPKFDWGTEESYHSAAQSYADVGTSPAEAQDLPEVIELFSEGWELAPDAPFLVFLPAIWPPELRTWIPDRATRYSGTWSSASPDARRVPWSASLYEEIEADNNALLAEVGIGPRPPGRLWLLKPPPPYESVDALLEVVQREASATGIPSSCNVEFVRLVAEILRRIGDGGDRPD